MAVERVNNDSKLTAIKEHDIAFAFEEIDTSCNRTKTLINILDQKKTYDIFIGGYCDVVCEMTASLISEQKKVMLSYGCTLPSLSNKKIYPYFARMVASFSTVTSFYIECLRNFNYTNVAIFVGEEYVFQQTLVEFEEQLQIENIKYDVFSTYHNVKQTTNDYNELLEKAKESAHVFILFVYAEVAGDILYTAHTIGMTDGQFVFFTLHAELDLLLGDRDNVDEIFTGVLDVTYFEPLDDPLYIDFLEKVKNYTLAVRRINGIELDGTAAAVFNSVLLVALVANKTYGEGGHKSDMYKNLFNWKFTGIDGPVIIDDKGDRKQKYMLRNIFQRQYHIIKMNDNQKIVNLSQIVWPGRKRMPPLGRPVCGFENEFCQEGHLYWTEATIAIAFTLFIAGILFAAFSYWQTIKKRHQGNKWKIVFEELIFKNLENEDEEDVEELERIKSADPLISLRRGHFGNLRKSTMPAKSLRALYYHNNTVEEVRVKYLTSSPIDFNLALKEEINKVFHMKHDNLNRLVGVCPTSSTVCIVSINCRYGSLRDTLIMPDRSYDWGFKTQFALDIAKGMQYLHDSEKIIHGRLSSLNVLVDSVMQCKIEDYGMNKLRKLLRKKNSVKDDHEKKLWIAPELLGQAAEATPTKKADVYSFAIILQEIAQRKKPFEECNMEINSILKEVCKQQKPPFRPQVDPENIPKFYYDLMLKCWEQDPDKRPSFAQAVVAIRNSPKELHEINLVEKIANQMDDLVKKKTREIEAEKTKSDRLLSAMLPRSVIGRLRNGLKIAPERYESATISFCDIVSFTTLAADSSPLQIVNFLNALYETFDQILSRYNVYKVETIGDNYMLVSNVPDRCDTHAAEVANVALDVMDTVQHYEINHRPDWTLQVRIGINTGPCLAGVVGSTMPRYCLFGYTVVLSSRMESSSQPMKIHITHSTKKELDRIGGFQISDHGYISIKGYAGNVKSYFVEGRQREYDTPITEEFCLGEISPDIDEGPIS